MSRLGDRIRQLRKAKKLPMVAIANKVRVTVQSVWEWETGKSQVPSEDIPRIAELLGVSISELYGVPAPPESVYDDPRLSVSFNKLAGGPLSDDEAAKIRAAIEFVLAEREYRRLGLDGAAGKLGGDDRDPVISSQGPARAPFRSGAQNNMPRVSPFYSINEASKPQANRVYHDNSACRPGQDIPANERRAGTNNYRECQDCIRATSEGR